MTTLFPQGVDPYLVWLSFGVLLCIAEMIVPGVFLMWLGIAALITGTAAFFLPIPTTVQLGVFAVLAIASVFIGRRWSAGKEIVSDDPMLNDRLARLIGEPVVVEDAIVGGRGRVRVGDGIWPATGSDAPVGARLRVTGADGGVLRVEG
jgi:inner membrane protein